MNDLPCLETKIVECSDKFDTYNGERLKTRLKLHDIPYSQGSWIPVSGKQWAAEFFTDTGYSHRGGWIWYEQNVGIWAASVNEDLYKKRETDVNIKYPCTENSYFSSRSKLKYPLEANQYFFLLDGSKAVNGDIVALTGSSDIHDTTPYEAHGLIYWTVCSTGYHYGWELTVSPMKVSSYPYYDSSSLSTSDVFKKGSILSPKEGYYKLDAYYRKEWRRIHGVKGQPKFI